MVKRKSDSANSSSNKKNKINDDENIKIMIKKAANFSAYRYQNFYLSEWFDE